jgi:nitroreductase
MDDQRKALSDALNSRFGDSLPLPQALDNIEPLLAIASYTSHRSWTDQQIDPDLLRVLAACALSAPSKSYLQQADIIEVRDPERRQAVEALVPSMPWMNSAASLLVFCGNGRRFRKQFQVQDQAFTNEHLDGFFNPVVDASLVMMNFIQAAATQGLSCCPISVLRDQAEQLAEILELPDHVVPIAGLCVGYPSQTRSINPRLSLKATLHIDGFNDENIEADLAEFDERYVAARRAIIEASVGSAAGAAPKPMTWSEEKVKQYSQTQRGSWGQFVRGKKFNLS